VPTPIGDALDRVIGDRLVRDAAMPGRNKRVSFRHRARRAVPSGKRISARRVRDRIRAACRFSDRGPLVQLRSFTYWPLVMKVAVLAIERI